MITVNKLKATGNSEPLCDCTSLQHINGNTYECLFMLKVSQYNDIWNSICDMSWYMEDEVQCQYIQHNSDLMYEMASENYKCSININIWNDLYKIQMNMSLNAQQHN